MKKTFKIGEYVVGGIIEVVVNTKTITINFKDYYSKKVVVTNPLIITDRDIERDILFFIGDNGTHYYADKVLEYINSKVDMRSPNGMFGW